MLNIAWLGFERRTSIMFYIFSPLNSDFVHRATDHCRFFSILIAFNSLCSLKIEAYDLYNAQSVLLCLNNIIENSIL